MTALKEDRSHRNIKEAFRGRLGAQEEETMRGRGSGVRSGWRDKVQQSNMSRKN